MFQRTNGLYAWSSHKCNSDALSQANKSGICTQHGLQIARANDNHTLASREVEFGIGLVWMSIAATSLV